MFKDYSLLLVEDDAVDVMSIKRAMAKLNLKNDLYVVNDGLEAKEFMLNNPPKLLIIFLDLQMPRMNGHEFLEWLRSTLPSPSPYRPVIILTTSKDELDLAKAYDKYAAGYIIKPVDTDDFVTTMTVVSDYWSLCEHPNAPKNSQDK